MREGVPGEDGRPSLDEPVYLYDQLTSGGRCVIIEPYRPSSPMCGFTSGS